MLEHDFEGIDSSTGNRKNLFFTNDQDRHSRKDLRREVQHDRKNLTARGRFLEFRRGVSQMSDRVGRGLRGSNWLGDRDFRPDNDSRTNRLCQSHSRLRSRVPLVRPK